MTFDCIISQVHIPDFDVQGNLTFNQKTQLVDHGLRHLRRFNTDSYIILSGHGHRPRYTEVCNFVYWEDKCRPLNEHGYVEGMPAQFPFVSKAIKQAKKEGHTYCLKTRGDCVIGIPGISDYCHKILTAENKPLLITQQTGDDRMGDCFMYGEIDLMDKIWDENNPVHNPDGLQNTAINFRNAVDDHTTPWFDLVKKYCAFRDVDTLKFMCLRWNYHKLTKEWNNILEVDFDYAKYHWGKANGWHAFNKDRTMRSSADYFWCASQFYR